MITFTNTLNILNEYGQKIKDLYREKNIEAGYDPAAELQNISFNVESDRGNFAIVFTLPDYWYYAEHGRGPGKMPPKGSLMQWMKFKQILPSPLTLSNGKTVLPSMESLEFLIRRKIGEHGTEGQHTWEITEQQMKNSLISDVKEALTKDFTEYLDSLRTKK